MRPFFVFISAVLSTSFAFAGQPVQIHGAGVQMQYGNQPVAKQQPIQTLTADNDTGARPVQVNPNLLLRGVQNQIDTVAETERRMKAELERRAAEARRQQEQAADTIDADQQRREKRCADGGGRWNCERHRAALEQMRSSGKTYDEAFADVSRTIPSRRREGDRTETDRPTHSDAQTPRPGNNPVDPAASTETGKQVQQTQPVQQPPQAQQQMPQQQQQQQPQQAYDPNQDLRSKVLNALGGMWQPHQQPTPTPTQKSATNPNAFEWPAANTAASPEVEAPPMDTEVSTGIAQAAQRCYMKATQTAQTCSGALMRAQGVSAQIQHAQLSASSGSPTACASVGNATASANQQIQAEQNSCAAALAQCAQVCASASSQTAAYPSSDAAAQAAEGASACQSAQATSSSISVNQAQIQAAYLAAAQCYQQTTGTEFTPSTGAPTVRRASADFGKGTENGGIQSSCPGGVCAADANTGGEQMPNAAKLLVEDESGGRGGAHAAMGGGYPEVQNMPDFGSKFQATTLTRKVAMKPGQVVQPQAAAAPAKNPGFFIKDKEAERRAREFANLPRTRGQGGGNSGDARQEQKPGLERFVRRPANQMGIGAKHTNIFTTITQSYARHSDRLQP